MVAGHKALCGQPAKSFANCDRPDASGDLGQAVEVAGTEDVTELRWKAAESKSGRKPCQSLEKVLLVGRRTCRQMSRHKAGRARARARWEGVQSPCHLINVKIIHERGIPGGDSRGARRGVETTELPSCLRPEKIPWA